MLRVLCQTLVLSAISSACDDDKRHTHTQQTQFELPPELNRLLFIFHFDKAINQLINARRRVKSIDCTDVNNERCEVNRNQILLLGRRAL